MISKDDLIPEKKSPWLVTKMIKDNGLKNIPQNLDKSMSECQDVDKNQPRFKCIVCSAGFEVPILCTKHITDHHKISANLAIGYVLIKGLMKTQLKCIHCPDMIFKEYRFETASHHLSTCHSYDISKMSANEVRQFFKIDQTVQCYRRLRLGIHIKLDCPMCPFSTSGSDAKRSFEYHVHSKHNMPLPENRCNSPCLCSTCGKQFPSHSICKRHEKLVHSLKTELCPICGKILQGASSIYKSHMELNHSTEKYYCPTCGKAFKAKKFLRQHSFIHGDYRPFSCNYCNYGSVNVGNMKVHLKTHHSDLDTSNGFTRN